MAKRGNGKSGNGKTSDPMLKLLTSIDERLALLVEGQERLEKGQVVLTERVDVLTGRVDVLTQRMDNMLGFIGDYYRDHARRLSLVEERLTKAGL